MHQSMFQTWLSPASAVVSNRMQYAQRCTVAKSIAAHARLPAASTPLLPSSIQEPWVLPAVNPSSPVDTCTQACEAFKLCL